MAGLVPDVAEQLEFVRDIYNLAKSRGEQNYAACFKPLRSFIRFGLKEIAKTESEWKIIEDADIDGTKYAHETNAKEDLGRILDPSWVFDCPICQGFETVVAELAESELIDNQVVTARCACVQCGFVVGKDAEYMSKIVLASEIEKRREKILKELGQVE